MLQLEQLRQTLEGLGINNDPEPLFVRMKDCYERPERWYHNEEHIDQCLSQLQLHRDLAEHPYEVSLAIWFHDLVYDSRATDNEQQSARLAVDYLTESDADPAVVRRIEAMILATKGHEAESSDEQLMLDIDLSILAASEEEFERYDRAIRKEYQWVDDGAYRDGRRKVLQSFLTRDRIFQTKTFFEQCESKARANLERKIEELSEQPPVNDE